MRVGNTLGRILDKLPLSYSYLLPIGEWRLYVGPNDCRYGLTDFAKRRNRRTGELLVWIGPLHIIITPPHSRAGGAQEEEPPNHAETDYRPNRQRAGPA